MQVRRWEDDVLLCNNCTAFSGFSWRFARPILTTLTGVSVPQKVGVRQRFWTCTWEFASDDPVNTLSNYDAMVHDTHNDDAMSPVFFRFVDTDGTTYKCRIMELGEPERLDFPTEHVIEVVATFKQDGHIS